MKPENSMEKEISDDVNRILKCLVCMLLLVSCHSRTVNYYVEFDGDDVLLLRYESDNEISEFGIIIKGVDTIFHGPYRKYDLSGTLLLEACMVHGEIVGELKRYWTSGVVKEYSFFDALGDLRYVSNYDTLGALESQSGELKPFAIYENFSLSGMRDSFRVKLYYPDPPHLECNIFIQYCSNNRQEISYTTSFRRIEIVLDNNETCEVTQELNCYYGADSVLAYNRFVIRDY